MSLLGAFIEVTVLSKVGQISFPGHHRWCQKHDVFRSINGVPDHGSLTTGLQVKIVLADMHTTGNVRALFVDADWHLADQSG